MSLPTNTLPLAAAAAAMLSLAGCQSLEDCARETFSKEVSCPTTSITVKERQDLNAYDLSHGPGPEPPKEVKDDPARYAVWKKEQDETSGHARRVAHDVYEAKGCDHQSYYECFHPSGANGAGAPGTLCTKITPPTP